MNIYNKMTATSKVLLTVATLLSLTACKRDFNLLNADDIVVGNGSLEITANSPSPAHVVINGKEFSGTWNATKVYEADVAKRHRLISTRSYQAYMLGQSTDQLRYGRAVLTAQDGTEVVCEFYYRAQPKSGNCSLDGNNLKLILSD